MANDFRNMHKSITLERVVKAVERYESSLDNPGFCIHCGQDADECEPDVRNKQCVHCGRRMVFGASELLMNLVI